MDEAASGLDIVVVDADGDSAKRLTGAFPKGTRFEVVRSTADAEALLSGMSAKVLICADDLTEESGLMFLARTADAWPGMQRILLAPALDPELFFHAMKEVRLFHYLSKPVDPAEVARVVRRSLRDSGAPLAAEPAIPPARVVAGETEDVAEKSGLAGGFLIGLLASIALAALILIPLTLYLLKSIAGVDFFPDSHLSDWFR